MAIFMCAGSVLPNVLNIHGPHCCLSSRGKQGRLLSGLPQATESDSMWGVTEGAIGLCLRLCLEADQPITGDGVFVAPSSDHSWGVLA